MDTEDFTAKRRRLGWSLRDVERESGIAFSTLARFERGERVGARVAAGIATWVADPDPKRRIEVALTRDGRYLVGYSNEGEAGGFILLGDITDQLASFASPAAEREEVAELPWSEPHPSHSYPNWHAMVPSIHFEARIDTSKPSMYGRFPLAIDGSMVADKFDTVEAAKAYAQAKFADRILALLAKRPPAEGEAEVPLDGNDIWEALFGIMKGNVPDEMTETVCERLAALLAKRPTAEGELREAFQAFFDHVEADECKHEDTYRGGAIWTICRDCDRKWADDRGGFRGYVEPAHIAAARAALGGRL